MISLSEIENRVKNKINTQFVKAIDLRGGDHIQLILVSSSFIGKTLVEQHKLIYEALSEELASNEIHALTLKTYTPESWESVKDSFKIGVDHII